MLWWKWLAPDKTPDKSPSQSCSSATEEKRGNSSWHHHKKESRAQETVWQMTLKMNKTHKKGNTSGPPPVTIYSRNIGTEVIRDGSHVIGAISVSTMSVVIIIIIIRNSYIAPNPTWLAQSTSQFKTRMDTSKNTSSNFITALGPINMRDPIQKHFGYGHYTQHAARIRLDYTCLIQLPSANSVPFFQRRPGSHYAKPTQIRSGWCGQVLGKCILSGSKLVCKNHWAQFAVSGRMQLAYYRFPTFRLGCILP